MVLQINLLLHNHRIADQFCSVHILPVHIHCGNLSVSVGCIIVNSTIRIAAGGVKRLFISAAFQFTAPTGLLHRTKDVKKLADTLLLRIAGNGIHLYKSSPDKPGLRG